MRNDQKNDEFLKIKKRFEDIGGTNLKLFGEGGFGQVYYIEYYYQ